MQCLSAGKYFTALFSDDDESKQRFEEFIDRIKTGLEEPCVDCMLETKRGKSLRFTFKFSPLYDSNGYSTEIIGIGKCMCPSL